MGLSDEGLVIVLVLMWVPLLVSHFFIVRRAMKLTRGGPNVTEFTRNLVSLVAFILILSLYVIVCTISMFSASQDKETSRTTIIFIAELVWWFSPVIATLSIIKVSKNTPFHNLIPSNREGWILCVKRSLLFGIPLCGLYAVGDQFLRQVISIIVNQDTDVPIPVNYSFLESVGTVLGYSGDNPRISYLLGFIWNISIGPFVNLFAPAMESVYEYGNGLGLGLFFFYAIPEEIGWTGALYPMMLGYFAPDSQTIGARFTVLKAMTMTGLIWGMWHCPYIVLKWNPAINTLSSFVYNILFVLSCIATRYVLISLVWPIKTTTTTTILEGRPDTGFPLTSSETCVPCTIRPSLVPAIYAHAAMNVWWNFYNCMYVWQQVPTWSILVGSEYSVTAVLWQMIIGLLLVRPSWSNNRRQPERSSSL